MSESFRGIPVSRHGKEMYVDGGGYLSVNASRHADPKTLVELQVGDQVWMVYSYGGQVWIKGGRVDGMKKGRIYTDLAPPFGGCAWYQKSGKNTYAPKGQSFLAGDSFDFAGLAAELLARAPDRKEV